MNIKYVIALEIMFFQILFALIAGMLFGTITGIVPGVHVNLVATTMFALSPLLLRNVGPLTLAILSFYISKAKVAQINQFIYD